MRTKYEVTSTGNLVKRDHITGRFQSTKQAHFQALCELGTIDRRLAEAVKRAKAAERVVNILTSMHTTKRMEVDHLHAAYLAEKESDSE